MTMIPEDIYATAPLDVSVAAAARRVLILTDNKVEDCEFFYPYYRFAEAGHMLTVATPSGGAFSCKHGDGLKDSVALQNISAESFDLLYLPGGKAAEKLCKNKEAVALVRHFAESGKPVAALCHGPLLLSAADVVRGRQVTSWPEVRQDLEDAGARWTSSPCVCDGNLVTGRWPADLPAHLERTLALLKEGSAAGSRQVA